MHGSVATFHVNTRIYIIYIYNIYYKLKSRRALLCAVDQDYSAIIYIIYFTLVNTNESPEGVYTGDLFKRMNDLLYWSFI